MNKKLIVVALLVMTVCFLLLGVVFRVTAENQKGLEFGGVIADGQYIQKNSGTLGGSDEKYELFYTAGTWSYVLSGIAGVMCVVTFIADRKSKK